MLGGSTSRNSKFRPSFTASRRLLESLLARASPTTKCTADASGSPDGTLPARPAPMEFITTCAVVVAGLVYARRLVCVVPKGALRFVLLLPCVAVNVGVPTLCMSPLGPSPGVLACAVAVTNFGWWTNFKLLALSAGRGQLAECSSLPRVSRGRRASHPTVGQARARGCSTRRARRTRRARGALLPRTPQLSLLAACVVLIPRTPEASAARCLAQSFALYAVLGAVMDVSSLVAAGVFDLHLAPHFDKPFLAASISEFWAERWNLVAGAMLRDLARPSSATPSTRPRPRPRRDPSRRLVSNLTPFARPSPPSRVSPRAAPRTSASSGTWSVLRVASTDDGRCFFSRKRPS